MRLEMVPVDSLAFHPDNPRLSLREDVVESLASRMREEGFPECHALLVRPWNGAYQVVSGHHRLEAAKRAGLEAVPCWVREMTDEEAFMELVLSNQQGELTPLERGKHAWQAVRKYSRQGLSVSEYAKRVGVTHGRISQLMAAFEVYESVRRLTDCSRLRAEHFHIVSKADREDWPWLCEMAAEKELSARVLEEAVAETKKIAVPPEFAEWLDQTELRREAASDLQRKAGSRWAGVIARARELYESLPEEAEVWVVDEAEDAAEKAVVSPRREFVRLLKEKEVSTQSGCEQAKLEVLARLEESARTFAAWQARKAAEAEAERLRLEEERRRLELLRELEPKVYYKSCLAMDEVPDESVDLVFADLPYGLSDGGVTAGSGTLACVDKGEWDRPENVPDPEAWLRECLRVLNPGGSIYVSGTLHNIFDIAAAMRKVGFTIQNDIVWYKKNAPPLLARQDMYVPSHETILFATKGPRPAFFDYEGLKEGNEGKQVRDVWEIPGRSASETIWLAEGVPANPAQKPEALFHFCYQVLSEDSTLTAKQAESSRSPRGRVPPPARLTEQVDHGLLESRPKQSPLAGLPNGGVVQTPGLQGLPPDGAKGRFDRSRKAVFRTSQPAARRCSRPYGPSSSKSAFACAPLPAGTCSGGPFSRRAAPRACAPEHPGLDASTYA